MDSKDTKVTAVVYDSSGKEIRRHPARVIHLSGGRWRYEMTDPGVVIGPNEYTLWHHEDGGVVHGSVQVIASSDRATPSDELRKLTL